MHYLLQKNIWNEPAYANLVESIRRRSTLEIIDLIPFTSDFVQEVHTRPEIVFGSNRFVDVCRGKGYPVFKTFDPEDASFPEHLLLNARGSWHQLKDLRIEEPVFIKPRKEKYFTGLVVQCQDDLGKIQFGSSENDGEEWVRVSPPAVLGEEVRFFVVGGVAVTGSRYKFRGGAMHQRIPDSHPALDFAREVLRHGNPDAAFVLDVCETADSWFIVELNNFNSAGLYQCDTDRIVEALENTRKS